MNTRYLTSGKDLSMTGRIVKLHASGTTGVAEIKPDDGTAKISRKLQRIKETE